MEIMKKLKLPINEKGQDSIDFFAFMWRLAGKEEASWEAENYLDLGDRNLKSLEAKEENTQVEIFDKLFLAGKAMHLRNPKISILNFDKFCLVLSLKP